MELHQLEYFLAVAKYHNFTRAADEISVSQSSLSQQISKLEDELGIRLFERTTRTVLLTPAGNGFLTHANKVLSEIVMAKRTIQEYISVEKGHIKIGVFPAVGHYDIISLIASFYKSFPGIKLDLLEAECEDLMDKLHKSVIDVAFLSEARPDPQLQFSPLISDELVLVTSLLHPLATRQTIELQDISEAKFILFHPNSGLYKNFIDACKNANIEPNVIYYCSRVENILGLVSEDLGVSVLSSQVTLKYSQSHVAIVRITPKIPRTISLAVSINEHPFPTVKVFVKFVQQWMNTKQISMNTRKG